MSTEVVTLKAEGVTLSEVAELLKQYPYSGFPIVVKVLFDPSPFFGVTASFFPILSF